MRNPRNAMWCDAGSNPDFKMKPSLLMFIILAANIVAEPLTYHRHKRYLPNNQSCNPSENSCRKGDFVDTHIADCHFERTSKHPLSCTAGGNKTGSIISWIVAPDKNNLCKPVQDGVKFNCGDSGTNTRCVCSDYKVEWNKCRCQYWTDATPGEEAPAFCTAYYLGGSYGVHHYACCNNCNDSFSQNPPCDKTTYEGGSTSDYCGHCGKLTGGGNPKKKWYFNCVNCSVQEYCQTRCNELVSTIAGLCWKWVNCFKGCCTKASRRLSQVQGNYVRRIVMHATFIGFNKFFDENKTIQLASQFTSVATPFKIVQRNICGDKCCSGICIETFTKS